MASTGNTVDQFAADTWGRPPHVLTTHVPNLRPPLLSLPLLPESAALSIGRRRMIPDIIRIVRSDGAS